MMTYCWRKGYCYEVYALYLGNKLIGQWDDQGNDLELQKVLSSIGARGYVAGFARVEIGAWIEDKGVCPDTLEEFNSLQSNTITEDMFGGLNAQ